MRLSTLDQYLETVTYTRGGESLEITMDSNAFTSEFYRTLSTRMRQRLAEIEAGDKDARKKWKQAKGVERTLLKIDEEARSIEVERDIYAEMLSSDKGFVIKGWSATDDDESPAPPTFENLQQLSPRALKEIFQFLRDYKRPLEQEIATTLASETISETTERGSEVSETSDASLIG